MPADPVLAIPDTIQEVRRTGPLSVSSLSAATSCLLKVVLDGESRYRHVLPPPPEAHLGRLIHRAMASPRSTRKALKGLRRRLLEGGESVRSSATDSGHIELRDALGVARLLERIGRHQAGRPLLKETRLGPPSLERFAEKLLVSRDGELRGRVDLLEIFPDGSARITDFKTGSTLTESGDPKPEYRNQLRAYGYLVIEEEMSRSPRLRLIGSEEIWESEFGPADHREVERELESILNRIPREKSLAADDLASFGPACRYCGHRPVCGTYLEAAPKAWTNPASFPLPNDTWGRIVEVRAEVAGTVRLRLEDAADRPVSILGVPERLVEDFVEGVCIWLFALRGVRKEKSDRHFQNFRIKAPRPEDSAHGALVMFDRAQPSDNHGGKWRSLLPSTEEMEGE